MIYILCIFLPPVAILLKGKPIQACINFLLCLLFWIPGVIHAIMVVNNANNAKRHKQTIKAIKNSNKF